MLTVTDTADELSIKPYREDLVSNPAALQKDEIGERLFRVRIRKQNFSDESNPLLISKSWNFDKTTLYLNFEFLFLWF